MKIWVDGTITEPESSRLSPFDHGFTVGDGVFETCKVVDGQAFALSRHLRRLARSATGLALPVPDESVVREGVSALLAAEPAAGRVRITYTGGPGPLGSDRGDEGTTLVIAVSPGGRWEPTTKVSVVPWTRNERSAVAGLKTTSYAENVVALAYAHDEGASEAILANSRGELCEGTGSNIFVVLDGGLVTPSLRSGCLAGITRELVIEWCGAKEVDLDVSELEHATEAFLTSSTRDVQPIHAIDARPLASTPGLVTESARATFHERSASDIDP
ncbi:MAG TPA: aminodeoxychorismate lyase [Actinomycetes bacterium]|nr:aminodeoxychorismate lyase [Actinomycetes bacterium]